MPQAVMRGANVTADAAADVAAADTHRPRGLWMLELGEDIEGPADVYRAAPWLLQYVPAGENGEIHESRRIIARLEAGMASGDARLFADGLTQGYFRPPDWVPRSNMPRPPSSSIREASERLLVACWVGDADIVRGLLQGEGPAPDVNTRSPQMDLSPLMLAADGGHADVARLIVGASADINAQCSGLGFTALHWACRALSVREPQFGEVASKGVRTVQELCKTGQCERAMTDETGWTARDWAVHSGSYSTVDFLDQYEALALLAARQRLCLALMTHARADRDSPTRLLPGRMDGGCDLIACCSSTLTTVDGNHPHAHAHEPYGGNFCCTARHRREGHTGSCSVLEHLPFARGEGGWWSWTDARRLYARAVRGGEIADKSTYGGVGPWWWLGNNRLLRSCWSLVTWLIENPMTAGAGAIMLAALLVMMISPVTV